MGAVIKKYQAAKKAGIKLIFGCEVYLCDDIEVKDKMDSTYKMYYVIGNMFKHNTDSSYLSMQISVDNGITK